MYRTWFPVRVLRVLLITAVAVALTSGCEAPWASSGKHPRKVALASFSDYGARILFQRVSVDGSLGEPLPEIRDEGLDYMLLFDCLGSATMTVKSVGAKSSATSYRSCREPGLASMSVVIPGWNEDHEYMHVSVTFDGACTSWELALVAIGVTQSGGPIAISAVAPVEDPGDRRGPAPA